MRIQETDRILKESRITRTPVANHSHEGLISRVWHAVTRVFKR